MRTMPETLGRAVATNSAKSWDRESESKASQQMTAAATVETLLAFRHRIIAVSVRLDAVLAHHRAPELHLLGQEPSFLLGAGDGVVHADQSSRSSQLRRVERLQRIDGVQRLRLHVPGEEPQHDLVGREVGKDEAMLLDRLDLLMEIQNRRGRSRRAADAHRGPAAGP